jgi:hypothetical protein
VCAAPVESILGGDDDEEHEEDRAGDAVEEQILDDGRLELLQHAEASGQRVRLQNRVDRPA